MAIDSLPDLVHLLRQHHFLEPSQFEELSQSLTTFDNPRDLARDLLVRGWLTAYQVNQLLAGKGKELVLGQYLLLERLSDGVMGHLFRARHQHMKRTVTLQLVRKDLLGHPQAVERFYQEIQAVSQLSHPHLVTAYDAGPVGASHFVAMEYVDGIDLERLVQQTGPLPVAQACDFMYQTALGLQHAYQHGLLHHDLKPANILVAQQASTQVALPAALAEATATGDGTSKPVVKIRNLGLTLIQQHTRHTRVQSGQPREANTAGNVDYGAPQLVPGQAGDIRAELYSLGCTFYYLLTGRAPFPGGTAAEKVRRHLQAEPTPIASLRREVPADVAGVVRKLMAKRPGDRYQTPAEVAKVLAQWAGQGGSLPAGIKPESAVADGDAETVLQWAAVAPAPTTKEVGQSGRARLPVARGRWRLRLFQGSAVLLGCLLLFAFLLFRTAPSSTSKTGKGVANTSAPLTFAVEANQPWQDTHIDAVPGRELFIRTLGKWKGARTAECGANGDPAGKRDRNVRRDAASMCLLLRLGNEDLPVVAGTHKSIQAKQSGRLFVQANDLDLNGNTGQLTLEIEGGRTSQEDVPLWLYGWGEYDAGARRMKTFVPLPYFEGSGWQPCPALPDPALGWVLLHAEGGHPGKDKQYAVIRRWRAARDGAVSISGTLVHLSKDGDGVQGRVVSSRHGEVGTWVAHGSSVPTTVGPIELQRGDTIDCVVDCRGNHDADGFTWAPVLRLLPPAALKR